MEVCKAQLNYSKQIQEPKDLDNFFIQSYQICEKYFSQDQIQTYQNIPSKVPPPGCCFLVRKYQNSSKKLLTDMKVAHNSDSPRKETEHFKYREGTWGETGWIVRVIEAKNAQFLYENQINKVKSYYIVHTFFQDDSQNVINNLQFAKPSNMQLSKQIEILNGNNNSSHITNELILQPVKEMIFNGNNQQQNQNQSLQQINGQQIMNQQQNSFNQNLQTNNQIDNNQSALGSKNIRFLQNLLQKLNSNYQTCSDSIIKLTKRQLNSEKKDRECKSQIKQIEKDLEEQKQINHQLKQQQEAFMKFIHDKLGEDFQFNQTLTTQEGSNQQTSSINQIRRSTSDITHQEVTEKRLFQQDSYYKIKISQQEDSKLQEIQQILKLPIEKQQLLKFFISKTNLYTTEINFIQQFQDVEPSLQNINLIEDLDETNAKFQVGWVLPSEQSFDSIFFTLIQLIASNKQLIQYKKDKSCLYLFNKEATANINLDANFMNEIPKNNTPFLIFYYQQQ